MEKRKEKSEGKIAGGGYASFNEYGELMETDTLQKVKEYYIDRATKEICETRENAIIKALDSRPRYLRWLPKKYYAKHFIEIHEHNTRPLVLPVENGLKIETEFRIYDKLRKKYVYCM